MPEKPSTPTQSDEALFETYRRGDLGTLRVLIERHQEDLLRFLVRLMGDRQLAEDVFQDAFLQVHQSADTFDATRKFRPWLFTIAANKGRDMLRKKGRRQEVDLHAPVSGPGGGSSEGGRTMYVDLMEIDIPTPGSAIEDEERDGLVQRALGEMPYALREILLLAYFQRLSYSQIAAELGIPLGTVKSRLHSAVASFATKWKMANGEAKA